MKRSEKFETEVPHAGESTRHSVAQYQSTLRSKRLVISHVGRSQSSDACITYQKVPTVLFIFSTSASKPTDRCPSIIKARTEGCHLPHRRRRHVGIAGVHHSRNSPFCVPFCLPTHPPSIPPIMSLANGHSGHDAFYDEEDELDLQTELDEGFAEIEQK